MGFTQPESSHFSLTRRHSSDGIVSLGSGPTPEPDRGAHFHPYRRQFSDGAVEAVGYSQLQEVCSLDTHPCRSSNVTWDHYKGLYLERPAVPVVPYRSLSQNISSYSLESPLQQGSSKLCCNDDQSADSKYTFQSLQNQSQRGNATQSAFPKPIYSYSILIFMALKNSKTGSLPVSEIYSFMTEHFPYFKTAPDGWKNSVRHNLSLNKCFEKVENKHGNASRKGCLWALNPAKVEKMQEELHKWRRKDPQTVRRSMARPEELDRLLGEKPNKLRSLPPYTNCTLLTQIGPVYSPKSSSTPSQQLPCQSFRPSQYPQSLQHYNISNAVTRQSESSALYSPVGRQPVTVIPSTSGCLNSPLTGKVPHVCDVSLPLERYGSRRMQDLLQEGDTSYDIDNLNPSLTDLQLQGNFWEELRDDSLASEPHIPNTDSSTFILQDPLTQISSLQGLTSVGTGYKVTYEDEFPEGSCWAALASLGCSEVDSLTGYSTSCSASVSSM